MSRLKTPRNYLKRKNLRERDRVLPFYQMNRTRSHRRDVEPNQDLVLLDTPANRGGHTIDERDRRPYKDE